MKSFEDVLKTFKGAKSTLGDILSACELMDKNGYNRTIDTFQIKNPLSDEYPFYMLLETRSVLGGNDADKVSDFVGKMMELNLVDDGFVTDEPTKVKVSYNKIKIIIIILDYFGHNLTIIRKALILGHTEINKLCFPVSIQTLIRSLTYLLLLGIFLYKVNAFHVSTEKQ